jgi:predicted nucleic acid-binding protein
LTSVRGSVLWKPAGKQRALGTREPLPTLYWKIAAATRRGRGDTPLVDASVVVDWVAPGAPAQSPAMTTLRRLAGEGAALVAPRLLLEEVTNALLTGVRRRRWTGASADAAFVLLRQLPVQLVDTSADLDRAFELARRYDDYPLDDMLYVAVAERIRTQFITADAGLRERLAGLSWVVAPDAE